MPALEKSFASNVKLRSGSSGSRLKCTKTLSSDLYRADCSGKARSTNITFLWYDVHNSSQIHATSRSKVAAHPSKVHLTWQCRQCNKEPNFHMGKMRHMGKIQERLPYPDAFWKSKIHIHIAANNYQFWIKISHLHWPNILSTLVTCWHQKKFWAHAFKLSGSLKICKCGWKDKLRAKERKPRSLPFFGSFLQCVAVKLVCPLTHISIPFFS